MLTGQSNAVFFCLSLTLAAGMPSPLSSIGLIAAARGWQVSWISSRDDKHAGHTVAGKTDWQTSPEADYLSLYIEVQTYSTPAFGAGPPRYFTSLTGTGSWRLKGSRNIFFPSPSSFRVYVVYTSKLTAGIANKYKWSVNWIACSSGGNVRAVAHESRGIESSF